jgi:hypothetical protein
LRLQIDVAKSQSVSGTPLCKIPFTVKNIGSFQFCSVEEVKEEFFDTPNLELLNQNMWLKFSSKKGWSLKEKVGSTPRDTFIQYENYVDKENIRNRLAQNFSGIFSLETYFTHSLLQFKVLRHFINDQCYIDKLLIDEKPYLFGSCFCSFCQHIDSSMHWAPTKVVYLLWKNHPSVFEKITPLLSQRVSTGFVVYQEEENCLTDLILKSKVSITQPTLTKEMEQQMQIIKNAGPGYFFESDEDSSHDMKT